MVKIPERPLGKVDQSFHLIGVGASAGGLDAIKQLISQTRPTFSHSFVIIQHISPDYKSLMSEILGRETSLPVAEVEDDMPVEPGRIYLIPPRSNVVIQGTKGDNSAELVDDGTTELRQGLRFSLVQPSPRPALNLPIDVFFMSLAEAVQDRAIAIVLSGTGSDGSRGLRAVKERDGFVMVQDPKVAAFDGMPRAAIATGLVDLVLSPDDMISELLRYLEMRESGIINVNGLFEGTGKQFSEVLSLVSEKAEIDFSSYKMPTLQRRVARRMALRGVTDISDYLEHLRHNSSELNVLCSEFLVGVTNFFRDLPIWKTLEETVLPRLFVDGNTDQPVRVWSVGCSTGEEAFTIAMMLERFREENNIERDFRIFATDMNEASIAAAKQGVYPDSVRDEIPDDILRRNYLTFQSGTFAVAPKIRNRVVFAVHNVMDDAPYTRTDLIICRNLLIYLSPDVQAKVMTHFSFSLRKDGYLLLGAAETTGQHGGMFEAVVNRARIYRNTRRVDAARVRGQGVLEFPAAKLMPRTRRFSLREQPGTAGQEMQKVLLSALHDSGSFVCIVDETGRLLQTFGEIGEMLSIPKGGFSANFLDLIDDGLRSAVALTMRRAELDGVAEKLGVRAAPGEANTTLFDVKCRKIAWETHAVAYSFTFVDTGEEAPDFRMMQKPSEGADDDAAIQPQAAYIAHLESEVQSLQDMLSATAEDLGASNEELQTTNEELIAANEELQANNEETQSINEELHTVNAENAEKITELEAATVDINNLLATAELGVLVLNSDLCIRRFSTGSHRYIELEAGDIGRPLDNFSSTLQSDAMTLLLDDARLARDFGEESGRELRRKDGGWAFVRTRPYRSVQGEPKGVVITLLDTTETKILEEEVRKQRDRLEGILESEAAGYWDWIIPEDNEYMSPRLKSMFGYKPDEIENTRAAWKTLVHPDDLPVLRDSYRAHVRSRGAVPYDNQVRYLHKDGSVIWVLCRGRVVEWSADGNPVRMMGVHVDVTPLKRREEEVWRKAEEVRRFAFIAAHDLLQPMNTIESSVQVLLEHVPDSDDPELAVVKGFLGTATERMRTRVSGVLDYAKLRDEQLEFERVDLSRVAEACLADLRAQITEAGAEIQMEDLPTVLGAPSLILVVFQNLLSNALKYRRRDRRCQIKVRATREKNNMIATRVIDNGIGIPEEYRKRVFELFARLHSDDQYGGDGLGLSLTERIIAQHGGHIGIEDGWDGGVTFYFTLRAE